MPGKDPIVVRTTLVSWITTTTEEEKIRNLQRNRMLKTFGVNIRGQIGPQWDQARSPRKVFNVLRVFETLFTYKPLISWGDNDVTWCYNLNVSFNIEMSIISEKKRTPYSYMVDVQWNCFHIPLIPFDMEMKKKIHREMEWGK